VVLGQKWFCGHGFTVLAFTVLLVLPELMISRRPLKPARMAAADITHTMEKSVIDGTIMKHAAI
jgi:hypothetical protein